MLPDTLNVRGCFCYCYKHGNYNLFVCTFLLMCVDCVHNKAH